MMNTLIITSPGSQIEIIQNFCKQAFEESADENMSLRDDKDSPSLLKHIKYNTIPMITAVTNGKEIISLSGVQKLNSDVGILGKRFYTLKKFRRSPMGKPNNFFQDYMYQPQLQWASDNKFKVLLITFNEHNKRLIPVLQREQKKGRSFESFRKLSKKLFINSTDQHVLYKILDTNYDIEKILK